MQKRGTRFFVMSVVAAVLATGCATGKSAEAGTSAESGAEMAVAAERHTSEHNVTNSTWAMVESGPLSMVGAVGVGQFDGVAECYASEGPTCGAVPSGTRVFTCEGRCSTENGGRVEAGQILCCGSTNGSGGKLRVTYAK